MSDRDRPRVTERVIPERVIPERAARLRKARSRQRRTVASAGLLIGSTMLLSGLFAGPMALAAETGGVELSSPGPEAAAAQPAGETTPVEEWTGSGPETNVGTPAEEGPAGRQAPVAEAPAGQQAPAATGSERQAPPERQGDVPPPPPVFPVEENGGPGPVDALAPPDDGDEPEEPEEPEEPPVEEPPAATAAPGLDGHAIPARSEPPPDPPDPADPPYPPYPIADGDTGSVTIIVDAAVAAHPDGELLQELLGERHPDWNKQDKGTARKWFNETAQTVHVDPDIDTQMLVHVDPPEGHGPSYQVVMATGDHVEGLARPGLAPVWPDDRLASTQADPGHQLTGQLGKRLILSPASITVPRGSVVTVKPAPYTSVPDLEVLRYEDGEQYESLTWTEVDPVSGLRCEHISSQGHRFDTAQLAAGQTSVAVTIVYGKRGNKPIDFDEVLEAITRQEQAGKQVGPPAVEPSREIEYYREL